MSNTPNLTLISLFAGAGGMDIGFKKAGFKTVWTNEYDKTIAKSYQNYFPKTKLDNRSILNVPNEDIPIGITGVIGGPPPLASHGQKREQNEACKILEACYFMSKLELFDIQSQNFLWQKMFMG